MSAREAIFAAIERALGKPADPAAIRAQADALLTEPGRVRPHLPDGDLVGLFEAAVKRLPPGASCERLGSWRELPAACARRLGDLDLEPALKIQPLRDLETLDWAGAGLVRQADVDDRVSLSVAEKGIAETASLVVRSGPAMAILDAFLPLHHLVALRTADIVPHLEDAVAGADLARSRNLVIVTGPSGTTDIEGSLVIGVHGPATLHIFLVEG
ncbi:LUD domain-containing protein [Aureimonas sp. AU22]|uniref:LutC/YkgG family protein n=1 Tax=Aureimonas sp. AU22 TaxID=1638162 RepID=UPI000784B5BE|nr:LUD domain-containing protein [Aureimonas sp. AU22]